MSESTLRQGDRVGAGEADRLRHLLDRMEGDTAVAYCGFRRRYPDLGPPHLNECIVCHDLHGGNGG